MEQPGLLPSWNRVSLFQLWCSFTVVLELQQSWNRGSLFQLCFSFAAVLELQLSAYVVLLAPRHTLQELTQHLTHTPSSRHRDQIWRAGKRKRAPGRGVTLCRSFAPVRPQWVTLYLGTGVLSVGLVQPFTPNPTRSESYTVSIIMGERKGSFIPSWVCSVYFQLWKALISISIS